MVSLAALWLPILLSAVIVFVASSIIHMVLPYHRSEYHQLPDEDNLLSTLRAAGLKRGFYNFPFCTHKDMKSPRRARKIQARARRLYNRLSPWPTQHGQVPRAVVWLLPGDRFLRRVSHRAHSQFRRSLSRCIPRSRHCRFPRLWSGKLKQQHLERSTLEHDFEGIIRRPGLRPAHRRHLRLALAPLVLGCVCYRKFAIQ